uniref:Putative class I SAM-dependent methyltransferase n=1 Tax=uncultured organism TaxID=155900 RepID=A0A8A1V9R9_9ZZZZ|nr:putative class I SAM-dependent methyltransferase [uncultured organism]
MVTHETPHHGHVHDFDAERARRYDQMARQTLPGYEDLHHMASSLLGVELGETARVLVVGAGTGMELLTLAAQHPRWRLTGVDPSAEMLAVASERLHERGLSDRVQLHVGNTHELPETDIYDAATCLLVIHHLPETEQRQLLHTVARRLKSGAPLIVAEMIGDPTSPQFQRLLAAWKLRQYAFGTAVDEVEQRAQTLSSVVCFPSEERLRDLLATAGFVDLERFFSAYFYGGWIARLRR